MEAASGASRCASCAPTAARRSTRWLMQFQADVLGVPVVVPEVAETTALGAALLAGVGAGLLDAGPRARAVARARRATSRAWATTSATTLLARLAPRARACRGWAREG